MAENVAYDRGLADPVGAVKRLIRNGALFDDLLLHGKIVATVHEDEADMIAKVLPWHAEQVRHLRSLDSQAGEETT